MENGEISLSKDEGGLDFINVSNQLADAKIYLQGGHVVWWKPRSIKEDVLWLSSNARYEEGRSIRGGIPICWPWFGNHPTDGKYCVHGFARVALWNIVSTAQLKNGASKIILKMTPSESQLKQLTYNYELELTIIIGDSLHLNLQTKNLSDHPFTISEGFHTYFNVSDIKNVKITGLENSVYTDKFDNFNRGIEKESIQIDGPFDRVYLNTSNDCYIEDENFNRVITIKKSNSDSSVIWTPWKEKALEMQDMGCDSEWLKMICVETANLLENSIVIYPGISHSISTEYSVQEF